MKRLISSLLICAFFISSYAQKQSVVAKDSIKSNMNTKATNVDSTKSNKVDSAKIKKVDNTKTNKVDSAKLQEASSSDNNNFGWGNRFTFFVGGGFGATGEQLYDDPVINLTNNFVEIESSKKLRTSLTLGIVFSPWVYEVRRIVYISDKQGKKIDTATLVEHVPRKLSFGLFMNPISLTKLNDNGFTNSVDLGFGVGWREGDFLFMATIDYFSIRQPRKYFVDQYKDQNKTYIVNGQIQNTIDVTNNNLFHNIIVPSFGIKMCYTFDLAKSFYSNAQQLTK